MLYNEDTKTADTILGSWFERIPGAPHAGTVRLTLGEDCTSFAGTTTPNSSQPSGTWTGTRIGTTLAPRQRLVIDTYRSTLCRDPEAGGRVYWTDSVATPEQIIAAMQATQEWAALQPVRNLYLELLARDPVPGDCRFLFGWINSHKPLSVIADEIAASPEGQRVRAVRDLYLEILGRDPIPDDRTSVRRWVESRLSLDEIRAGIAASPEAQEYAGRAGS